jgi:ligand-binding sensor domain-containing protein/two-component sensor histidine kinase
MRGMVRPQSVIPLLLALALCNIAFAERLPLRHVTPQEGLAGNVVHKIVRDSRDLLWFSTNDGLSRFDGHSFVTFGVEHGLGDQEATDVLEASDGTYWIGTARGVSRMDTRLGGGSTVSFANFYPGDDRQSQWILKLLEDRSARIWIATIGGLYRMSISGSDTPAFHHIPLASSNDSPRPPRVLALAEDSFGHIWAGGDRGLFRILDDGSIERYSRADGLPGDLVLSLARDGDGALWAGVHGGICRIIPEKDGRADVDRIYRLSEGLSDDWVRVVYPTGEWLWAGTVNGLVRLPVAGGDLQVFGTAHGLRHPSIESLTEDREGNLWIGTMGGGASRLTMDGFTTYGSADGLASVEIADVLLTNDGALAAISKNEHDFALNVFNGERFLSKRPSFPSGTGFGWGWAQIALQDSHGEWWIATGSGAARYPAVSAAQLVSTKPRGFLSAPPELTGGAVFRLFADSRGDLWISTSGSRANGLARWVRRTGLIERFHEPDGLPGPVTDDRSLASAFAEDAAGTVWIGFHTGGLYRFRAGRLSEVDPPGDTPIEGVRWIHRDAVGRLWVAGRRGLHRIDDPGAEQPVFRHYAIAQGLASNFVLSLAEDDFGRIYIGSGRGVDRLDPDTGHIRHYGVADGLVGGDIRAAQRDRQGGLWFASAEGLSRHEPRPERRLSPPSVFISQVQIGDYRHTVDFLGAPLVEVPPVGWRNTSLYVGFLGVGENLRYQYQMEGVNANWSEAGERRNVHYAGLAPGTYRFVVRAVNADSVYSQPAAVHFRIDPPFWDTWWFRLTLTALILSTVFGWHRMRVAKAVAIERIRHRIATDLHDDVGASLCHAALLSDLVHRDSAAEDETVRKRLEQISNVCRDAVDSMSDIVWVIDPQKDKVGDLAQRMRSFAEDVLTSRGIELSFSDRVSPNVALPPEIRHQIFLVFKEAIHNVVRHSGASVVRVELCAEKHMLALRISDNGRGMPPECRSDGHGFRSMQERARAAGGTIRVDKREGLTLEFTIPLTRVDRATEAPVASGQARLEKP